MSKLVLVETVSTFRHTYVVKLPDNEPDDYALDDVTDAITSGTYQDKLEEVSQNHIAEDIFSHRVITEKEYLEMFDRENAYLSGWPTEKKMEFIFDSLKNREAKVHQEVNWGPDVGREILSEDC
jgi:hypothetical protein